MKRADFLSLINLAAFGLGLALFAIGLAAIYWPLGLIGPGVVLMGASLLGGRRELSD